MLSDPDRDIRELWTEMAMQDYLDGNSHPVIAASARDMLDRPEEEAGSVLSNQVILRILLGKSLQYKGQELSSILRKSKC